MNDNTTTIKELKDLMAKFVHERDWDQFHDPKSLSMAIATEAAEIMEHFLWSKTENALQDFNNNRQEIEHEVADVALAIMELCNICDIDLAKAIETKMSLNEKKYPVEKAKGKAVKYNKL